MGQICALFGITRQAHYQQVKRDTQRRVEEEVVLEVVRQVRRKHPRLGTRKLLFKIQPMLAVEGLHIGRDRLFRLLGERNMLVKRTKTYRRTTTPGYWRTPNLLPGMTILQPNRVWVCDITYLEVELGRFAYLFLLMDLYSRFIVGWHVANSLTSEGAVDCLRMALKKLTKSQRKIIHHSDHGVQYTARPYMEILNHNGICPSMGEVGNCYDNVFAERVIGTLKNEYYLNARFTDQRQVHFAAKEAIHNYNTDRPHMSLDMAVPKDVYFGVHPNVPPVTIPESDDASTNI
jgi:transposase InsO family protein